ncbi:threonine/serine dehydratase [Neomegalonema sp.]|uniref:threonine ammonia-lyase n=1 Tax=Neomegalonema sp. TaxID=2039713 RepID=UPI00261D5EA9|nr:threonine/serine dehydratase [Neomegalonema sp.]MDD2867225.1 threonine/serine dehydratase [Neomegalonema sp.]
MSAAANLAPPGFGDVLAAAGRLAGVVRRTPLLEDPFLNEQAGRRLLVKAECLQRTGSFKFRGAWNRLSALQGEARTRGVVAFSSGNHAQGVAYAAKLQDMPAVIVMPKDAPAAKIGATRRYGAEVVLYDRRTEDRAAIARRFAEERGLTLVPPFDDPFVIAGQGTVGLEIADQALEAGVTEASVLVNCSGGGLASGVALALAERAPGLTVRTAEPEGFDDWARSLEAGAIRSNHAVGGSIQDALMSPSPGVLPFAIGRRAFGPGLAVSDEEALRAMAAAFARLKIVLEPGGAASLAAALFRREAIRGEAVIVVASGGNVDPAVFARALATGG